MSRRPRARRPSNAPPAEPDASPPPPPAAPLWGPNAAPPPPAQPGPSSPAPEPSAPLWGANAAAPPPPATPRAAAGHARGSATCRRDVGRRHAAAADGQAGRHPRLPEDRDHPRVILIVGLIVFVFLIGQLFSGVLRSAGVNPDELGNNPNGIGADCPFLSDQAARDLVGGNADASDFSGLFEATLGLVIDRRALPDAPDCVITDGEKTYLVRIAKSDGNGPAVYAKEKANAQPTSQDQGGGVTLENPGYFGGDVSGVGDEAFCTGLSNAIMAGVVARKGDTVVAVSVGPPSEGQQTVPDMENVGGVTTAPGLCKLAGDIALQVLP